jgi:hypothetical protein
MKGGQNAEGGEEKVDEPKSRLEPAIHSRETSTCSDWLAFYSGSCTNEAGTVL